MSNDRPDLKVCDYNDTECPICGGKLYDQEEFQRPWDACVKSESCDESGGTTDYIAICFNKFRGK